MDYSKYKGYKRYFFVDYENVNVDGMQGVGKLLETDCVLIYYSKNAETLTFGLHRRINESNADFDYIRILDEIKNALDVRLLDNIREIIKTNRNAEYYIVSNDKDYDDFINKSKKRVLIEKLSRICDYQEITKHKDDKNDKANKKEQRIRSHFGKYLSEYSEDKEEIISIILNSKSRQQINNELQKLFYNDDVKEIMDAFKPIIKDMPGK